MKVSPETGGNIIFLMKVSPETGGTIIYLMKVNPETGGNIIYLMKVSPETGGNIIYLLLIYVLRWRPSWISDRHKKQKLCRGPSNDHSCTVWL